MELKEIWDLILPELTQRSYRLMREADQEADKAVKQHNEVAERMNVLVSGSGDEAQKLFGEFCRSMGEAHSFEVEHAYVQGAKDCVRLLRALGVL